MPILLLFEYEQCNPTITVASVTRDYHQQGMDLSNYCWGTYLVTRPWWFTHQFQPLHSAVFSFASHLSRTRGPSPRQQKRRYPSPRPLTRSLKKHLKAIWKHAIKPPVNCSSLPRPTSRHVPSKSACGGAHSDTWGRFTPKRNKFKREIR